MKVIEVLWGSVVCPLGQQEGQSHLQEIINDNPVVNVLAATGQRTNSLGMHLSVISIDVRTCVDIKKTWLMMPQTDRTSHAFAAR